MRHLLGVVLVLLALISSSCQYWKNNVLFQTTDVQPIDSSTVSDTAKQNIEAIIQPHDVLEIGFSPAENLFGVPTGTETPQIGNVTLAAYSVDNQGYIQFPLLGKIFVKGMTLGQLRDTLAVKLDDYYQKPYVVVRLASFQINVLGEVARSGPVTVLADRATVVDAITLAGGMTPAANKKEVKIIRGDLADPNHKVYVIDFTDLSSFQANQEGFYLQPHDIVYVEPQRSTFTISNVRTILGFATALNTILILVQLFTR